MNICQPFYKSFNELKDPRKAIHSFRHELMDILILTILAVLCGAESWTAVEKFGYAKKDFLKSFLSLPNGIPSHDVIGNLFSRIDPKVFQSCFLDWVNHLFKLSDGEIIAIDGKTLRGSYDNANNKAAIHMVNAWACRNRLVLGQLKTEDKSNEITAIPELLKLLDLTDATVTIDAMGCQKSIAKQIIDQGGKYVFNLKGNHSKLHKDVECYFNILETGQMNDEYYDSLEIVEDHHGRLEIRRYGITSHIGWLPQKEQWAGLSSIGFVEYEQVDKSNGERQVERRFFISALEATVKSFAEAVRLHWGVESVPQAHKKEVCYAIN
jgi:predicted transposase YbfD/YdcC